MIINMSGAGAPGKVVTVHVPPEVGATVTCTDGKKTLSAVTDGSCNAVFKLTKGAWSVTAQKSGVSKTANVNVTDNCTLELSLEQIPVFTYTGEYAIVDDSYNQIDSTLGNWKIILLTSGVLRFLSLNGAESGIDVFLVGGGGAGGNGGDTATYNTGAGGGGGYTRTEKSVTVAVNTDYTVSIGAGGEKHSTTLGNNGNPGGDTSAFGFTAAGGHGAAGYHSEAIIAGGNGGSGGGGVGGNGGSDGADGSGENHGAGQGTTTREFGSPEGTLFAGGGGGSNGGKGGDGGGGDGAESGADKSGTNGDANTGGGGGGGSYRTTSGNGMGGSGGSGIVIIRNHREVA